MSELQIICLIILFAIANMRPLMFRNCSVKSNPLSTTSMISIWYFIGVVLLYPFYGNMLHEAIPVIIEKPYLLLIGFSKGAGLWLAGYIGQYLRSQSNSSCAYAKQVSIGGVAVINAMQGEVLIMPQWIAVVALVILGIIFTYKGHISELSRKYQLSFLAMIGLSIIPSTADYAVISQTNWYIMMLTVSSAMMLITVFKLKNISEIKKLFTSKDDLRLGAFMLVTEIAIMMILVTYVPVTMAVLVMSLSVPTMMVISSLLWKEGNWKHQFAFGCFGYIAMLPMVLM